MNKLLIIGIIFLIVIVGCKDTNIQPQYQPQSNPQVGGGGCGVIGVDSNEDIGQLPMGDDL